MRPEGEQHSPRITSGGRTWTMKKEGRVMSEVEQGCGVTSSADWGDRAMSVTEQGGGGTSSAEQRDGVMSKAEQGSRVTSKAKSRGGEGRLRNVRSGAGWSSDVRGRVVKRCDARGEAVHHNSILIWAGKVGDGSSQIGAPRQKLSSSPSWLLPP